MNRWQLSLLPSLGISGLAHLLPGEATPTSPEPFCKHDVTSLLGCENAGQCHYRPGSRGAGLSVW